VNPRPPRMNRSRPPVVESRVVRAPGAGRRATVRSDSAQVHKPAGTPPARQDAMRRVPNEIGQESAPCAVRAVERTGTAAHRRAGGSRSAPSLGTPDDTGAVSCSRAPMRLAKRVPNIPAMRVGATNFWESDRVDSSAIAGRRDAPGKPSRPCLPRLGRMVRDRRPGQDERAVGRTDPDRPGTGHCTRPSCSVTRRLAREETAAARTACPRRSGCPESIQRGVFHPKALTVDASEDDGVGGLHGSTTTLLRSLAGPCDWSTTRQHRKGAERW
jgi:hypothetical protein